VFRCAFAQGIRVVAINGQYSIYVS
jgi:hypothetical protein